MGRTLTLLNSLTIAFDWINLKEENLMTQADFFPSKNIRNKTWELWSHFFSVIESKHLFIKMKFKKNI